MPKPERIQNPITAEIWKQAAVYGLRTVSSLADACGLNEDKLHRRLREPWKFTVEELAALHRVIRIDMAVIAMSIQKGMVKK